MLANNNRNNRTNERKKRENVFVKQAINGINKLSHTYNSFDTNLFNYIKTKIHTILINKGKKYIRYIFKKIGVDKTKLETYVSAKYTIFTEKPFLTKLIYNIFEYYEYKDKIIGEIPSQFFLNNKISFGKYNIQLDENYIHKKLSTYVDKTNKKYNTLFLLLSMSIAAEITNICVKINIVDSLIKKDDARTDMLLHIFIKNNIISNCAYTIIKQITKQIINTENNLIDIILNYLYEHDIVSMFIVPSTKINFIVLDNTNITP